VLCPASIREPLGHRALRAAAEQARRGGSDAETLRAYRALLESDPGDVDAALFAARALRQARRVDEAIGLLSDALRVHPGERRLVVLMVDLLSLH
jgi:thioredoxin-like negative regulator of GroEL